MRRSDLTSIPIVPVPTVRTTALVMRWRARPLLAGLLRVAVLGLPIGVSAAVVWATSSIVPPPDGSLALHVCWWAGLSAVATIALVLVGRLSRRLLPLAALMRLSLVFPDGAPSRFRLARRSGTVATLEERLAEGKRSDANRTPVEEAQLLLELVAHLDDHDSLTRGHSERVRAYAQCIGRELGLDTHELELLNWAALLHDVGKLEVPHEVLTKAGRPTEYELELLRAHPSAGTRLATPLREWLGEWGRAIEDHHERWDGTGYPHGLAGTDISLAGRIVAVADAYDVITSSRTYKRAGSTAEARQELARCAGTQFDPTVVRAFLAMSVRSRRVVTGPLAWLAHAPLLARISLTPAAGVASAAAVATGVPVLITAPPIEQVAFAQVASLPAAAQPTWAEHRVAQQTTPTAGRSSAFADSRREPARALSSPSPPPPEPRSPTVAKPTVPAQSVPAGPHHDAVPVAKPRGRQGRLSRAPSDRHRESSGRAARADREVARRGDHHAVKPRGAFRVEQRARFLPVRPEERSVRVDQSTGPDTARVRRAVDEAIRAPVRRTEDHQDAGQQVTPPGGNADDDKLDR